MADFGYDVIRQVFSGRRMEGKKGPKTVDVPENDCHSGKQTVGEWFVSEPDMAPLMANS